jgi:hypothetical protein
MRSKFGARKLTRKLRNPTDELRSAAKAIGPQAVVFLKKNSTDYRQKLDILFQVV